MCLLVTQERRFVASLGEEITVDGRRMVIGGVADGLPINGRLPPDAPPIAVFSAHQGYLELGGTPYHLVTRRKHTDGFEVSHEQLGARARTGGGRY